MRSPRFRIIAACLPLSLAASSPLLAQNASPAIATAASCSRGNPLLRASIGATLGAWVGFVAAKIKLSDWNDASHGTSARRIRVQATVSGAALGAALGMVRFHHSCYETPRIPREDAGQSSLRRAITQEEIQQSGISSNMYDLVYTLRRNWLNVRGIETFSEAPRTVQTADGQEITIPGEPQLVVYLDNARLGYISKLRELPVPGVIGVRFYDPSQATFRWGSGHSHGAIQVLTVLDSER